MRIVRKSMPNERVAFGGGKVSSGCVEPGSCLGCRLCVNICPETALVFLEPNIMKVYAEKCIFCEICAEVCPMKILSIKEDGRMLEWKIFVPEKKHKAKFFGNLEAEVISKGICSHCTACASICPVNGITAGDKPISFPEYIKDCVDCGACVRVCPRWDYKPKSGIGNYIEAFAGRSKRFSGQDGAMVTEFIATAFEIGAIDAAVLVSRDDNWNTKVVTVTSAEQLKNEKLSGSKYSFADVMPAVKEAVLRYNSIAFVGTPCMITALRKMQENFKKFERVKLAIGIFCTENFYYHDLSKFLLEKKKVDIRNALKTNISKGKFIVNLKSGEVVSFSVKELDEIVPSGCKVCQDFSAVDSDISFGSSGSPDGFSTVIVRSEFAKKIADTIKEKGSAELGQVNIEAVKKSCEYKVKIHPYSTK